MENERPGFWFGYKAGNGFPPCIQAVVCVHQCVCLHTHTHSFKEKSWKESRVTTCIVRALKELKL